MVIKAILAEEIGENPCCSGNRKGFGDFAPIRMIAGIHEQPKDQEHHGQQASRYDLLDIGRKSDNLIIRL